MTLTSLIFSLLLLVESVYSRGVSVHLPFWALNGTTPALKKDTNFNKQLPSNWRNFSKSQHHEDVEAYESFFYGMTNGLVLETGGGEFSATLFLEKVFKWKAIHIEADPKVFKTLRTTRSNQIAVHAALCSTPRWVHFVPSHVQAVGIWETMSPSFIDLWHEDLKKDPKKVEALPVILCVTITNVLRRLGLTHINLWILDTDGTEEDVLKGLETDQITIDVIAFQEERATDDIHKQENTRKISVLQSLGYSCDYYAHENRWCKRKGFEPHTVRNTNPP
eukprot:gene12467-26219_t